MSADAPLVAGVELGGTKCIAVLARGSEIVAHASHPTLEPARTIPTLIGQLNAWRESGANFVALGLASFGPLGLDPGRADYGRVTTTPKPGWANYDLRGVFATVFDLPIGFDTDVNGAALAEERWGASRGASVHAYVTVGTGIGGGIVVGGRPVHGLMHPEMGHLLVRRQPGDGFAGTCPFHGDCLEGLASGPAIAARTGQAADTLPDDHPVWPQVAGELGQLVTTLLLMVSPQRIVIGGGVGVARPALLSLIRDAAASQLNGYLPACSPQRLGEIVVRPQLGSDAGPLGACALASDIIAVPANGEAAGESAGLRRHRS